MVKEITVSKIMSDSAIALREGEYFDEGHYNTILDEDTDVYTDDGKLLLKFRKNVIPSKLTDNALVAYGAAAKKTHENRGAAAGVLDRNKMNRYIGDFVNEGKFRTKFISNTTGIESKQATSNLSASNIAGYYDRPDRNLLGKGPPCRLTAFNRDNPGLWDKSVPFLRKVDSLFKELTPDKHAAQLKRCQQVSQFAIADTAYSTITINYSWRTALHKDSGDYGDGFGNLIVVEDSNNPYKYRGAYMGFPQYGVAVDVRTGDFLAMDVHEWHCNTEFIPDYKVKVDKSDRNIINGWHFNRLSIVCYLRNDMLRCKTSSTKPRQLTSANKISPAKHISDRRYNMAGGGKTSKTETTLTDFRKKTLSTLPKGFIEYMNRNYPTFFDY
tara:strand:+ start:7390 stop:8541 length:1152 start_codon:yes stop_codon:yes gene_type:complete